MQRRQFMSWMGSVAVTWPTASPARMLGVRRIAVLMGGRTQDDASGQVELRALRNGLQEAGWNEGRNTEIHVRWPGTDLKQLEAAVKELIKINPDVIFSRTTLATTTLLSKTKTIPVVFALVFDPMQSGLVGSLARPEGNATGFADLEASIGGKWVELLKEAAPDLDRMLFLYNPDTAPYALIFLRAAEAAAASVGVQLISGPVRSDADIESAVSVFAAQGRGGLLGASDSFISDRKQLIIDLSLKHRLPGIFANSGIAASGGLMSYSAVTTGQFHRAAGYIDRILKGAKVAELPVQHPTSFELAINLKTAKALGLALPPELLARVNESFE